MELLFAALKEWRVSDEVWHYLDGLSKETLCNRGAAVLLIPLSPFSNVRCASFCPFYYWTP